jgi:glycosyltransferase involved in cell wall biosynthesis
MQVTFVLPLYLNYPAGGFKVVYEYANCLHDRGHQVTLIHPRQTEPANSTIEKAKSRLWPLRMHWRDRRLVPWFRLRPGIRVELVTDLREKNIPSADAVIATGYNTAFWVDRYAAEKGRKFYLIQHYETWDGDVAEVNQTWMLPMHKIVIAKWLWQIAKNFGEAGRTTYIPNGLDFRQFRVTTPLAERPLRVGMLAHPFEWKGTLDGITALTEVKKRLPELQAVFFGTHPRPAQAPDWIEYKQRPDPVELLELYNSCAVFLHPSWAEGWPLPPAEAMACGCALVAAANPGVQDYAEDGVTALLAEIKNPIALADCLTTVLTDSAFRQRLAQTGRAKITEYTWERATVALAEVLLSEIGVTCKAAGQS